MTLILFAPLCSSAAHEQRSLLFCGVLRAQRRRCSPGGHEWKEDSRKGGKCIRLTCLLNKNLPLILMYCHYDLIFILCLMVLIMQIFLLFLRKLKSIGQQPLAARRKTHPVSLSLFWLFLIRSTFICKAYSSKGAIERRDAPIRY